MKELTGRHTADYLKRIIINELNDYNISLKQIYSVTSTNGRIILKSNKLVCEELQH